MDPNACLVRLLECIETGDREETVHALDDLREWIKKGGFLPRASWVSGTAVGGRWMIGKVEKEQS
jgi:hypothetical protein